LQVILSQPPEGLKQKQGKVLYYQKYNYQASAGRLRPFVVAVKPIVQTWRELKAGQATF
jgi:hypothetical protein